MLWLCVARLYSKLLAFQEYAVLLLLITLSKVGLLGSLLPVVVGGAWVWLVRCVRARLWWFGGGALLVVAVQALCT